MPPRLAPRFLGDVSISVQNRRGHILDFDVTPAATRIVLLGYDSQAVGVIVRFLTPVDGIRVVVNYILTLDHQRVATRVLGL